MNKMFEDLLKENKASCLLPLLKVIPDLDSLVEQGVKKTLDVIPKQILDSQQQLSEIDHYLEEMYDSLTDRQLADYSISRGKIRRHRRELKDEGAFLSRGNTAELVEALIKLIQFSRLEVTSLDSKIFLSKILTPPRNARRCITPSELNKLGDDEILTLASANLESATTETEYKNNSVEEKVPETKVSEVISASEGPKTESHVGSILNIPQEFIRRWDIGEVGDSPKDSLIVIDGINDIKNRYLLDTSFHHDMLIPGWLTKFNDTCDAEFKRTIIGKSYAIYYSDKRNTLEKYVADFAVWSYILPALLLKTNNLYAAK